ncbi:MAG: YncE family protein [Bacteroidota bacterium]|nr:YncE family protein [Bacteroidota bacterium]
MNEKIIIQLFITLSFCSCHAQTWLNNNSLKLITSISLPDINGRIDHLAFDAEHQVVFVAALGNNTVEAIDLKSKKLIHSIKNLREPQGVAFIPEGNSIFVANGDNGECDVFDAGTFQKTTSIKLSDDADNVRYDTEKNLVYVGYGSGGIAIIDAKTNKEMASIKLDGHPESFQLSKKQNKIYINVPDRDEIEVADLSTHSMIAKWKNTKASSNFPMALDEQHHRLFIGCRSPATLRVINTETGEDISSISCTGDADDLFYDQNDKLVFVSGGRGFIDVFEAGDTLKRISHIATSSGARTSLLLSSQKTLLLAVPARNGNTAALWIYKINK